MKLLIVTGMSGAGKSKAMDALEDIGFYCMDNVPPELLISLTDLLKNLKVSHQNVAIGVDTRSDEFYPVIAQAIVKLKSDDIDCKVMFIDASDDVLLNRYKETRRRHPLIDACNDIITDAISKEREYITPIRNFSDYIVDTSFMAPSELKEHINSLFLKSPNSGINILCVSYGAKYGSFNYADLCFDVRCLPNPFYIDVLKKKTGLDDEIFDYVFSFDEAVEIKDKLFDLVDFMLPLYVKEGKSQLVIAFCCTGGKHRSVSFARAMSEHLIDAGYDVTVNHRDINR